MFFVKVLVIGCGSIGRRHIKNALVLGHRVAAVDISKEHRRWVEENLKVRTYGNIEEAIKNERPTVGFVCTPPSSHISIARALVGHDMHLFIEKPLSNSLVGIDDLIKEAKIRRRRIAVGYNLRFNRGVIKIKELIDSGAIGKILFSRITVGQYLPDWRPWQDYRQSYTAKKSMGGGVILDASHELDYARWFMGKVSAVTCIAKKVSALDVETEDNADIILEFKSGSVANIHLDFVRRDYKRGCEIVGEKGTLELFFGERIDWYNATTKKIRKIGIREDTNNMYVAEIKHLLDCIKKSKEPIVNAEEGKKSLILALEAKRAAEKKRTVEVAL